MITNHNWDKTETDYKSQLRQHWNWSQITTETTLKLITNCDEDLGPDDRNATSFHCTRDIDTWPRKLPLSCGPAGRMAWPKYRPYGTLNCPHRDRLAVLLQHGNQLQVVLRHMTVLVHHMTQKVSQIVNCKQTAAMNTSDALRASVEMNATLCSTADMICPRTSRCHAARCWTQWQKQKRWHDESAVLCLALWSTNTLSEPLRRTVWRN